MKRKFWIVLLAVIACLTLVLGVTACDDGSDYTLKYTYLEETDSYAVAGFQSHQGSASESTVVIPATYKRKPVTAIAERAFSGYAGFSSVVIPDSVTHIGDAAFLGCSWLTSITFGNGVTSIGYEAFALCGFKSIVIPGSVTFIGERAFAICHQLTNVTIESGVTSIGDGMFSSCNKLTDIVIPDSVTSIGEAICGRSSLTSIQFKGTISEWNSIKKDKNWDSEIGDYTIYCTDGTIANTTE